MDSLNDYVDFYLKKLKCRDFDAAFHGLIEADHLVISRLIEIFEAETAPDTLGELVRIIWQHRQPSTIPFLGKALSDSSPEVWKNALDGLVALGSPSALPILKAALTRAFATKKETDAFRKWVNEAIDQLTANIAETNR